MIRGSLLTALALLAGCASSDPPPPEPSGLRYTVSCSAEGALDVRLELPPGAPRFWTWDQGLGRIEGLRSEPEGLFEATSSGLKLAASARELRYRYRIGDAADPSAGTGADGCYAVDGAAYLLRPRDGARATLRIEGLASVPTRPTDDGFALSAAALHCPGFHAFGAEARELAPGARLVLLGDGWDETALEAWFSEAWRALHTVLPEREVLVLVLPRSGEGVGTPSFRPSDPPSLAIPVGQGTPSFAEDWVLLRSLCRAQLPSSPGAAWIREGAATYLQHLAGWRAGHYDAAEALGRLRRGVASAATRVGRDSLRVLARTPREDHAYPALYWGGALFMLDLDLRLRGKGQRLEHLLDSLGARGSVSAADFAAEVDAACGAGTFAALEAVHLQGPALRGAAAVFAEVGLAEDGSLDEAHRSTRDALVTGRASSE